MTSATTALPYEERVTEIAGRLRVEGWDVHVAPGPTDLPGALGSARPDLVARRGEEGIVLMVLSRRVPPDPQTIALADAVAALPGWRLDVVYVAEEPAVAEQSVLAARAHRALALVDVDLDAALLLAWSSLEGTLRRLGGPRGLADDPPGELLAGLAGLGVVDDEQHERMRRGLRLRTALIHGREAPEITTDDVTGLIGLVHDLPRGPCEA